MDCRYVKLKISSKIHGWPGFVDKENGTRERIVEELRDSPEGMTINQIAEKVDLSRQTASKYILAMISEGLIKVRRVGPAKLCYLRKMGKKSGR